jgi:hypothetical protein
LKVYFFSAVILYAIDQLISYAMTQKKSSNFTTIIFARKF